jgi:hypothetical protein
MITDLTDFMTRLRDNTLWWQRMQEMYPTKDHLQITKEMHLFLLASPERLNSEDWADFRRLYQTFCRNSKTEIKVPVKPVESIPDPTVEIVKPIPRGTPEYIARAQEVLDAIKGVGKPIAPMTEEEKQQNGQVRPKAHKFVQSEIEKTAAFNRHQQALKECRRKVFLEAFPEAEEDEIQAYIDSFPI